jgi:putative chitinase
VSVDPLNEKYPELSAYQYASNRPITGIDLDGLEYLNITNPNIESYCYNEDGTGEITMEGQTFTTYGIHSFNSEEFYQICTNIYCTPDGISTSGTNDQLESLMFITSEELGQIFPNGSGLDNLASILNENLSTFGIKTPEALAHFLAQAGEETGGFRNISATENLNYSANRLVEVWSGRFSLEAQEGKVLANDYEKNPEKLGNYIYANRMGNGDVASGDGYLFRGRGVFQLTGKSNYTAFQTFYNNNYTSGINITSDPSPVANDTNLAIISALWYFNTRVMNQLDLQTATVYQVTRKVNGGTTGIAGRTNYYNSAMNLFR